jgi:hypothetical protein
VKRIDLQDTVFETFLKIVGRLNLWSVSAP